MIIDNLENISMYRIIPDHVSDFIKSLPKDIALGRHELIDTDYANVEEYNTKTLSEGKFESHNNYIDIQILLEGCEKIYYTSTSEVSVDVPYDNARDIMFYSEKIDRSDYVTLNGRNFAMIFPHEAHAPQIAMDDKSAKVKKLVVKVKV